ncbi:hypothetical protein [Fibrella aquatilis]|uniref:Uncharacterized protein n=1 Tax=Fibrella aquatilis TaxID=2817059 RepID=A0A939JU65_9BACT|nr:hypothetical protein [Fibrella aquatilis]MBO0929467.1 hypothetical protein [Fibrella aquatilis]
MAYSNFTLAKVYRQFQLKERRERLFPDVESVTLSSWLTHSLEIANQSVMLTEKAKSERIVSPILFEAKERHANTFEIYSGYNLNVDADNDLNGECDFLISFHPSYVVQAPIFSLVEAKNDNIELGLGQCVAQMLGARLFNIKEDHPIPIIYGCVTTGEDWQFLTLEDQIVTIDTKRYYLNQPGTLLGIFDWIVERMRQY